MQPDFAQDGCGQHLGDVVALGGQRVVAADEAGDRGLGQALGPAAPQEVGPLDPVVAHPVVDLGARLENDLDLLPRAAYDCRARMQSSVSSQPSGFFPIRPMSSANPPTRSNTSRRNDMLQPMRLRTSACAVGWPV